MTAIDNTMIKETTRINLGFFLLFNGCTSFWKLICFLAFSKLTSWSLWGGGSPKLAEAILPSVHALRNSGRDVLGSGLQSSSFIQTIKKLFWKVFEGFGKLFPKSFPSKTFFQKGCGGPGAEPQSPSADGETPPKNQNLQEASTFKKFFCQFREIGVYFRNALDKTLLV